MVLGSFLPPKSERLRVLVSLERNLTPFWFYSKFRTSPSHKLLTDSVAYSMSARYNPT